MSIRGRALLLSAYDAASHRLWRERLVSLFPSIEWTVLFLPARHFNWRIRGNSLAWAYRERHILEQKYDFLIATSMVDLSTLRGFVPALTNVPSLVYFHENQFSYPAGSQRQENVEPQLVPLYAALCANIIVFNSHHNRDSFLEGARRLFKRLPDQIPSQIINALEKSLVIAVPLTDSTLSGSNTDIDTSENMQARSQASDYLEVVWNHRWEYDKGIERLLEVVKLIHKNQLPIRLHILGESFRNQPAQFAEIESLLIEHASQLAMDRGRFGFIEGHGDYRKFLRQCDCVLSTALHDFQGLAVQEACLAGCTPLAPDALVYPEYLDGQFLYSVVGKDEKAENEETVALEIVEKLKIFQQSKTAGEELPKQALPEFATDKVIAMYAAAFEKLMQVKVNSSK